MQHRQSDERKEWREEQKKVKLSKPCILFIRVVNST